MKRSFGNRGMGGGSGNKGMGSSNNGGGGGMIRRTLGIVGVKSNGRRSSGNGGVHQDNINNNSVSRTNNNKNTLGSNNNNNILSLSTSCNHLHHSSSCIPVSATTSPLSPTWHSSSNSFYDSDHAWDWETVDGFGEKEKEDEVEGIYDRYIFGPVPTKDEVQDAVTSLQHFLGPASYSQFLEDGLNSGSEKDSPNQISSPTSSVRRVPSYGSELDWTEPSLLYSNSRMQQLQGYERARVHEAFTLLQNDSSVQRVVVSLSTDRAVWDAVLNNDVVRELRDTYAAENSIAPSPNENPAGAKGILSWILENSKAKLIELMDIVTKVLTEVFQPSQMENDTPGTTDVFQERLKSSLLLSIVVLLIVVMTRAHRV